MNYDYLNMATADIGKIFTVIFLKCSMFLLLVTQLQGFSMYTITSYLNRNGKLELSKRFENCRWKIRDVTVNLSQHDRAQTRWNRHFVISLCTRIVLKSYSALLLETIIFKLRSFSSNDMLSYLYVNLVPFSNTFLKASG